MTRPGRYYTAATLALAALAAPIILHSDLSSGEKVLALSAGTALVLLRVRPWRF